MKDKLYAVMAMVIILALVMTGCTNNQAVATTEPTSEAPVSAPQTTGEDETVATTNNPCATGIYTGPELTTEPVTLKTVRIQLADASEQLVQKWNQEFMACYPNITIEEDIVPFSELATKIQTEAASGGSADLFYADGPMVKSYAYYGLIIPLDDYLSVDFIEDMVPSTKSEHTFEGNVYAMPWAQSTVLLYFNKEMAAEAGVSIPESADIADSLTWEEVMEIWQKLQIDTAGDGTPDVWGLGASEFGSGGPGNYYGDGIWIRSFGDSTADPNSSAYKTFAAISEDGKSVEGYINTDEAVEGMKFYQSIYQTAKVSPTASLPSMFINGTAATAFYTDSHLGELVNDPPDFDWSATFVPKGAMNFTHGGSLTWTITAASEHPAEAAAYLAYLNTDDNQMAWWDAGRRLPARISLYDKIDLYSEYPYSMVRTQELEATYSRPETPGFSEYDSIFGPAIKNIALGADVKSTLAQVESDIQAVLDSYK